MLDTIKFGTLTRYFKFLPFIIFVTLENFHLVKKIIKINVEKNFSTVGVKCCHGWFQLNKCSKPGKNTGFGQINWTFERTCCIFFPSM